MSVKLLRALDEVKSLPQITLGSIVDHIEGEALFIVSLVSILPFMQPIPIPGLSSVLGLIVVLQGIGLTLWSKPLLTSGLKRLVIPKDKFEMIYKAATKFNRFTTKISTFKHPMASSRACHIICGITIILAASFLSLPLPIPFSNLIPALSIFLICVGLLEEDLMLIGCGIAITLTIMFMVIFSFNFILERWF